MPQVYDVGAPPGATVVAVLLAVTPATGGLEELLTVSCQTGQTGTWEFVGDWPPSPASPNAELLNEADLTAKYGPAQSYYWRITVPTLTGPMRADFQFTAARGVGVQLSTCQPQTI